MTKIVSGMGGAQSGLMKSRTNLASRVGNDFLSHSGPRADLDEAITFYAQLSRDTQDDLGAPDTFTRASQGLYQPYSGSDWVIAGDNVPRFESGRLLMEPEITNKCTNYNANPDAALTNMDTVGDPAVVLRRVLDSALIANSGFSSVCTSGYVYELDNSAGASIAYARIGGDVGSLTKHTVSAFGVALTGTSYVRLGGVGDSDPFPSGNAMARRQFTGTAVNVQNQLLITCEAGAICRFVLTHLEESPVVTSPIITQGAAVSRALDALNWADSRTFINDDAGMAILNYEWLGNFDELSSGDQPSRLLGETQSIGSMIYAQRANGNYRHVSYDGASFASAQVVTAPVYGDVIYAALRWKIAAPAEFQVGIYENGAWTWSTVVTYDGQFPNDGQGLLYLGSALEQPFLFSDLVIYNEDKGTAWIEANYP